MSLIFDVIAAGAGVLLPLCIILGLIIMVAYKTMPKNRVPLQKPAKVAKKKVAKKKVAKKKTKKKSKKKVTKKKVTKKQ